MGGNVMGSSIDMPAHFAPVNRPSDSVIRVLGLDGENVSAGGDTQTPADPMSQALSITDIPAAPNS